MEHAILCTQFNINLPTEVLPREKEEATLEPFTLGP
jgi:hypothetical protein